jgi:hypothetical protein
VNVDDEGSGHIDFLRCGLMQRDGLPMQAGVCYPTSLMS